jgi:hypothetical protein
VRLFIVICISSLWRSPRRKTPQGDGLMYRQDNLHMYAHNRQYCIQLSYSYFVTKIAYSMEDDDDISLSAQHSALQQFSTATHNIVVILGYFPNF